MLNLRRLLILQKLHEHGTMAAVADELHMTRPAVSQSLQRLEDEVGMPLLFRDGRNVRLTTAGLRLLEHTKRMLEIESEAAAELVAMRSGLAGSITLAGFGSAVSALLPLTLRRLHEAAPLVEVTVSELNAESCLRGLTGQDVDVAIIDDVSLPNAPLAAGIQVEPLYDDVLYVVMASDHPLAGASWLTLDQLSDEWWVLNEGSAGWHRMVMAALRTSGFEPRRVRGTRSFSSSLALVARGAGVTIQPALALGAMDPGLEKVLIRPRLTRQVFVAYRRAAANQPLIRCALEGLREAVVLQDAAPPTGAVPIVR